MFQSSLGTFIYGLLENSRNDGTFLIIMLEYEPVFGNRQYSVGKFCLYAYKF